MIPVRRLDPGMPLPTYAHPGDAGADLHAASDVYIGPGERATVPTGIAIALPAGLAGFIHPRSGLAARNGIGVLGGTVDAGYRGELAVILINHGQEGVYVARGDRIAQLVIQRVEHVTFAETADLPPSARGGGGFGSTGA
jgi:dUTP pyrophosphatase